MNFLIFTFKNVQTKISWSVGGFHLDLSLSQESNSDDLFGLRLKFILFWLHGEDLSDKLLLSIEVVLDRIFTIVFDSDGFLFWFSNSDGTEIEELSFSFFAFSDDVDSFDCDEWRNLESFSINLDNLGILLNGVTFSIFNF